MSMELQRVRRAILEKAELELRAYMPMVMMKAQQLAEELQMEIINNSAQTVTDGELEVEFNIPANTLLSEVTITPEMEMEMEMLDNGMVRLRMKLAAIAPIDEMKLKLMIYYAATMESPSYEFKNRAVLRAAEAISDAKAMEATLRVDALE